MEEDGSKCGTLAVIGEEDMKSIARGKRLRGVLSHPEYAIEDDGMGKLMTKSTFYYAAHGKTFAD